MVSSSEISPVAEAVPMLTAALLGALIVATTVSVLSNNASSLTGTLIVPVDDPLATVTCAAAPIAV